MSGKSGTADASNEWRGRADEVEKEIERLRNLKDQLARDQASSATQSGPEKGEKGAVDPEASALPKVVEKAEEVAVEAAEKLKGLMAVIAQTGKKVYDKLHHDDDKSNDEKAQKPAAGHAAGMADQTQVVAKGEANIEQHKQIAATVAAQSRPAIAKEPETKIAEKKLAEVIEKGDDLKERAAEKAHNLKEAVKEKAEELSEKAKEKVEEVREKLHEKSEDLKEKAVELKDSLQEKAAELKESLQEKAAKLKESLQEKASEARAAATEKGEELREKAQEKIEQIKEEAAEKSQQIKEKVAEKAAEWREKADEVTEKVKEKAGEAIEKGKELLVSLKEKGEDLIQKSEEHSENGEAERAGVAAEKDIDSEKTSHHSDKSPTHHDVAHKAEHEEAHEHHTEGNKESHTASAAAHGSDHHPDHHADHHGDNHHGHVEVSLEEGYAENKVRERLSYVYTEKPHRGFLRRLKERLTSPREVEPTTISAEQYAKLSENQKKYRVLLALEKLNAYNHHAFSNEEKAVLRPGNPTFVHELYVIGLSLAEVMSVFRLVWTRHYTPKAIGATLGFVLASEFFLKDFFWRLKERKRIRAGFKLANKYYNAAGRSMAPFAKILHPYTSPRELEHYSLNK